MDQCNHMPPSCMKVCLPCQHWRCWFLLMQLVKCWVKEGQI
uniref:Uncharacterized protein n=1 Tax=Lotus japonicus TaxID=34305 RepID=I3SK24_LOTJA|nr:unknown [Lotus japonicus]